MGCEKCYLNEFFINKLLGMVAGMKKIHLLQIIGASLWGLFFSVMPILEVLTFTAIVWVPLFIYLEVRRSRKYGFLPGGIQKFAIIGLMVMAASYAPYKYVDRIIEPVASNPTEITLREASTLYQEQLAYFSFPRKLLEQTIVLPNSPMSLKQLIKSIEAQTGFSHDIGYCGNGSSILRGGFPIGGIRFFVKNA